MAEIGKSLVFYNIYLTEMDRLYEDKKVFPEIKLRPDRDVILTKVDTVGHAAGVEARILLEACISNMQHRLDAPKVAKLISSRRATTEEKNWEVGLNVLRRKQRKAGKNTRQIGITLTNGGLTPWVWSPRGIEDEEEIRSCFAKGVKSFSSSEGTGWIGGTVPLTTIPIPWESAKAFTLDADAIIKRTQKVCETITRAFIEKLLKLP